MQGEVAQRALHAELVSRLQLATDILAHTHGCGSHKQATPSARLLFFPSRPDKPRQCRCTCAKGRTTRMLFHCRTETVAACTTRPLLPFFQCTRGAPSSHPTHLYIRCGFLAVRSSLKWYFCKSPCSVLYAFIGHIREHRESHGLPRPEKCVFNSLDLSNKTRGNVSHSIMACWARRMLWLIPQSRQTMAAPRPRIFINTRLRYRTRRPRRK